MSQKFNYKFETVKNVKKIQEKLVQKELALIEKDIADVRTEIEKLENAIKALHLQVNGPVTVKISELQERTRYEEFLDNQIKVLYEKVAELEKKRDEIAEQLTQKAKEVKVFETLKDAHFREYVSEQNRQDQIETDEIAVKKFVRGA